VKAIIVLKPDSWPSEAEFIAYARERIAGYKLPKSIDFVDTLPRTPSGKILKRELRERYLQGQERRSIDPNHGFARKCAAPNPCHTGEGRCL
jgi:acyl-CoA synthetase (AMP-forming)/AMP-acid ligase II